MYNKNTKTSLTCSIILDSMGVFCLVFVFCRNGVTAIIRTCEDRGSRNSLFADIPIINLGRT